MLYWRNEFYSHVDDVTICLIIDSPTHVRASIYTELYEYGEYNRDLHAYYIFSSQEEAMSMIEKIVEHYGHTRQWLDQEDLQLL
jgi:hypothetical protein